jgi:hypothetical protein
MDEKEEEGQTVMLRLSPVEFQVMPNIWVSLTNLAAGNAKSDAASKSR